MFTCSSPIYCVRCQRLTRISFERSPFGLLGEPCLTCPFQGWVPPFVRMRCLPHAEGGVIVLLSHVIDPPVVDRGLFQVAQVWVVRGICTRACIFPIYCMPRAPGSLDLLMCWLSPSSSACHLGATKCPGSCVIAVTDSCADSAASSHILRTHLIGHRRHQEHEPLSFQWLPGRGGSSWRMCAFPGPCPCCWRRQPP